MPEPRTIHALVSARAQQTPDARAIGAPGRPTLSYAALAAHVEAVGRRLRAVGVARGERVAIVLPNGPEMATAFLSIASFATAAPLNPAYREPEFEFFLTDLAPRALVIEQGLASPSRAVAARLGVPVIELVPARGDAAGLFALEGAPAAAPAPGGPAEPDDTALVLHTSGTTSRPKIVPLSHANVCASAHAIARTLRLGPSDRALNVMPLYHIHGLMAATLASIAAGACVFATPGFDASRFFAWYAEIAPTWYTAVPTIHQAVLAAAGPHEALLRAHPLRFARSSSAALPPPVMAELERVLGAPVLEAYGMTEASHQMASNPLPPAARKPGTVGLPTIDVTILDAAGDELPRGARGEISIRGPSVTQGYADNPKANAAAFTNGWFRTGDEGYLDEDGYLVLSGRIKEIINKAGEKVSPREIDEVLMLHPAVLHAVTFALPHPTLGEDVGAAVVLRPGATADEAELRAFAAERLAEFKVPQRVLVVPELPKGPTGKLKRIGLAEHFAAELAAPRFAAPRGDVEARLAAAWAAELKLARVGIHDNYFVLGGDSLQAVMLAARAKEAGVAFTPSELFLHPTIAELAAAITTPDARGAATVDAKAAPDPSLVRAAASALGVELEAIEDAYPLLPFQHGIVARYEPRLSPSAFVTAWQVDGPLDEARLRAALASVVEATPALRTGFARAEDGTWLQVVLRRAAQVDVAVHDVRALPAEARRARARAIVDEAHRAPFDLARPPLVRAVVVREDDARATLAFVWFHAGFDLWSVGLVERDVLAAYDGRAPGAGPTPFREAVRRALAATTPDADAAFFRGALAGLDEATLTRFWRGPDGFRLPSGERDVIARPLEAPLLGAVAAFGRARALTSSTLLHGAWALAAAHYLRVDDVLFGSVVSGRWGDVPGIEGVVGPTMEVVPVRARVRPGDALVPWLAELQARLAELQRFAHTPWERVAAYFDPPRRNVPAWSALVVENLPAELWERPSATLRLHDLEHTTHMVPPVVVSVFPFPTHHVKATFDPAFFTRDDAGRLLDAFERALAAIAAGAADVAGARAALDASFSRWGP